MLVRVLVVDDSRFFRRRVKEMLESDSRIKVIGTAENGLEAIQKSSRLKPDVITMDIEMPVMDGITATKRILATQKIPILMFSSLTTEGAKATLDALDAGAVDFLPKRFEDISNDQSIACRKLCDRVLAVVRQNILLPKEKVIPTRKSLATNQQKIETRPIKLASLRNSNITTNTADDANLRNSVVRKKGQYKLIIIGTSTGGPVALQKVLSGLPANYNIPILLVQHMPASFTNAFAKRLDGICKISVREAVNGDPLLAGTALLAPGGKQMKLDKHAGGYVVRITDSEVGQNYKPSVDTTLSSVAKYEFAGALVVILTGMGADGCKGAQELKKGGATIWAQDEASCVVYGMPAAVTEAGIVDCVLSLDEIQQNLVNRV